MDLEKGGRKEGGEIKVLKLLEPMEDGISSELS